MTNANALPIQERLRDSPHALRLTREAADHIDALEKALEPFAFLDPDNPDRTTQEFWEMIYRDRVQDWYDYEDIAAARAALGEGE